MTTDIADSGQPHGAGADSGSDDRPTGDGDRKHLPVWQETILLLAVALGLAVLIKAVFLQAFYIPSPSMEPGLVKNDRILVQKVSYWFGKKPQRGDVVVFKDPGEWLGPQDEQGPSGLANALSKIGLYPTGGHLVKRVIGTEGDVVVCCDSKGRIEVNGKALDEGDYVRHDQRGCDGYIEDEYTDRKTALARPCSWTIGPIPAGKVFVMGDNRGDSADSRAHICAPDEDPCTSSPWVDTDLVVGKVFTLIWPRERWRWVGRPGTFDGVPDDPPAALLKQAENLQKKTQQRVAALR